MFDIGMTELLIVGIVALIVVGPKDLPGMFRTMGRFTARAKSLGREFTRAMNDAADETGVKDVASDLKKVVNPKATGLDALKDAADKFESWDPAKASAAVHGKETAALAAKRAKEAEARRAKLAEGDGQGAATPKPKKAPAKKKPAAKAATPAKKAPAKKAPAKKAPAKKPPAKKPPAKPKTKPKTAPKPKAKTDGKSGA